VIKRQTTSLQKIHESTGLGCWIPSVNKIFTFMKLFVLVGGFWESVYHGISQFIIRFGFLAQRVLPCRQPTGPSDSAFRKTVNSDMRTLMQCKSFSNAGRWKNLYKGLHYFLLYLVDKFGTDFRGNIQTRYQKTEEKKLRTLTLKSGQLIRQPNLDKLPWSREVSFLQKIWKGT
jgi:hypothetical protein